MPTIRGNVYYTPSNDLTPTSGIPNVPVVLRDSIALNGAIAQTDINGAFVFYNVPNGTYELIEAWGTSGGIASPVNYPTSLILMPTAPVEAEPPLSAITVTPPALADMLMAISPNLLNLVVTGDLTAQNFYDAPVGSKPVVFNGIQMVGSNLITVADNGSFGSVPAGSFVNTIPATAPYPTVTPGLPYQAAPEITDGHYSIVNIRRAVDLKYAWWNLSDHETMLETGRFMFVNGDKPGAVLFTDTVSVTPDTFYTFTGWGLNLLNVNGTPPRFSIKVQGSDGTTLGYQLFNSINYTPIPVWYQGGFLFNSGVFHSVTVEVISEAPFSLVGNDYAIDELRLFQTDLINLLSLNKTMTPSTIYSRTSGAGQDITIRVIVTNTSNLIAPNVVFQDVLNPLLQFVPGSVIVNAIHMMSANPNIGFLLGNMLPGDVNVVEFHVTTLATGSVVIPNLAQASYDAATNGNGDVIRNTVDSNIANIEIIINRADIILDKVVNKAYGEIGDILTYTLNVFNTGNVSANNVVITDAVPAGTTFVAGSLTGATGTPPTLTLSSPVPAGGSIVIRYQVLVASAVPNPNPIKNSAQAAYTFTSIPTKPNGETAVSYSNTVVTEINLAKLVVRKHVDKTISFIGDRITYRIMIQNTGNVDANNVVLTDLLTNGASYVVGSLVVSVPYSGTLASGLTLINSIAEGQSVTVTFKVNVDTIPNPNPIVNKATTVYAYTVNPALPNGVIATSESNSVETIVFRYHFDQQISDLIESVALEQAALAAIANAEGAKIQKMVAMNNVSKQELLCLNKSVAEMIDSISILEAILKQKISIMNCQMNGSCM